VVEGKVRHQKGRISASIPDRDWEFPVTSIRLVGEYTTPGGPYFDYFYVFIAGDPPRVFEVPMEVLESVGLEMFFSDLEGTHSCPLVGRLANSVDYASHVMWPESMAGRDLFDFTPVTPSGFVEGLLQWIRPATSRALSSQVVAHLGGVVEWAV